MTDDVLRNDNLRTIIELTEAGKVAVTIDRRYPLSETAAAIGYVGAGHSKGKVVIRI